MHEDISMDSPKRTACIQACRACEQSCASSLGHCLRLGGRHSTPEHITLLLDCAKICATATDFMVRGSEHSAHTCRVCADICEACAQDCQELSDDPMMVQCAAACNKCAKACLEMAAMAAK